MSWIKLLFPLPEYEARYGWSWLDGVRCFFTRLSFLITQAAALLLLTVIYCLLLCPLRLLGVGKKLRATKKKKSYFIRSEPVAEMDFERMF